MTACVVWGGVFFLLGLLFVFSPGMLQKANNLGNRLLFSDERAFIYRRMAGIILFLLGAFILYRGLRL
ncbi:MAG: hypothetical protein Q7J67_04815 [bacterium]|nr:hypothetical protein [bacterium]